MGLSPRLQSSRASCPEIARQSASSGVSQPGDPLSRSQGQPHGISVYRTLVGLVLGIHGCRLAGLSHRTAIGAGLPPVLVAAGVAAAVHALVASFVPESAPLARIGLMGTAFTVVYGIFAMTLFRSSAMSLLTTVLPRLRRHRKVDSP